MRVGIVGSRRRNRPKDFAQVYTVIKTAQDEYGSDLVIVSGGCSEGADRFAKLVCETLGVTIVEYVPNLVGVRDYGDAVKRYYARNREIVEDSDKIIAQVAADRQGGTENTIRHAKELEKPVELI
jgi:hypothetical protein